MTPYLIGIGLALATGAYAALLGLGRDRAFYPTILIVTSTYYLLFAAIGGADWIPELVMTGVFVVLASIGFKRSAWVVVFGLAGHALLDAVHGDVIRNAGVPESWPAFCLAFDLTAAAWLASILRRGGPSPALRPGR